MAAVRGGGSQSQSQSQSQYDEASSSNTPPRYEYQVFLSFRGEDTRKNFTDHLYTALVNAGFHTFRDDDELERGEDIASELEKAIRQSQISVVVFSKDYASSRWCLDELANILQRKKQVGHMVLPVFYDIHPSDVRKQTGTFADAFLLHEKRFEAEMDRVEGWRAALREAADLAGMALQNQANGHEAQFIQNIIEEIGSKLNRTMLSVAHYPIGTDSRVEDINLWLQNGSSEIGICAIYGMGGIGKTTIAKIAYNMNFDNFERCSFLANIREASEQSNRFGLVRLQKQLLSDILRGKKNKVNNVHEGINKIKDALRGKRVLLVLDDVDRLDQLDAILGMRDWLHPGSKVVITTRHERLIKAHEVHVKFKVKELNEGESLQLFSLHAFGQCHPFQDYIEHSKSISQHCGGLPLALTVLGCSLRGRSVEAWESAIQKLKAIPDSQILQLLKISYDSLQDDFEKNLFLDIACFFIGKDKKYTITILYGYDNLYPTFGIQNLVDRCLIVIENDKLQMHQLLQDMGREIVRQESPNDPGKRSRLWDHKDAFSVLSKKNGTKAIEGLIVNFPMVIENMPEKASSCKNNAERRPFQYEGGTSAKRRRLGFSWHPVETSSQKSLSMPKMGDLSTKAFARMHRLRLLSLNYVQLSGGYENFPKDIRWLCWKGFPMDFIPTDFDLEKLVALEMRYSCLIHLWKGAKVLTKLKILDLSHSHSLFKTPDFSGVPNLEKLMLKDCISLVEVHESIGDLKCLVILNLMGCGNLRKLPQNIGNLRSLRVLNLSGCSIYGLPDELVNSEYSRKLHSEETTARILAFFSADPKQLWHSMWSWISSRRRPEVIHFSIALPRSLVVLSLVNSNLNSISCDIFNLTSLKLLNLSENPIHSVPELPTSLIALKLRNCTSLERITNLPNSLKYQVTLDSLDILGCNKLVGLPGWLELEPIGNIDTEIADSLGLYDIESPGSINVNIYNYLRGTVLKMPLQGICESGIVNIFVPGSEVPKWFRYYQNIESNVEWDPEITFKVPLHSKPKMILYVCVVYTKLGDWDSPESSIFENSIKVSNVTKGCTWDYWPTCMAIPEDEMDTVWLSQWKFGDEELKGGDEVTVSLNTSEAFHWEELEVKKVGMHVCEEGQEQEKKSNGELVFQRLFPTWSQNVTDWYEIQKDVAYLINNHSLGIKDDDIEDDDDDEL